MTSSEVIDRIAERINDERLVRILSQAGWNNFGGRAGLYSRWRPPAGDESRGIIVPSDKGMADYVELLREAIAGALSLTKGDTSKVLMKLARYDQAPGDEIRFRKIAETVGGAIRWNTGAELFDSARTALIASAKSRKSPKAYFGQSNTPFARLYLDQVLMGQTQEGSYIVTAYSPADEIFHEKSIKNEPLPNISSYTGREIAETLVSGLTAAREAIDHHFRTGSLSGFDQGVQSGLSYELVVALQGMLNRSEGSDVAIEWDPIVNLELSSVPSEFTLSFLPPDNAILERARVRFAEQAPAEIVTVVGSVTLLSRPRPGSPGVIVLDVLEGSRAKKVRVRLEDDSYAVALDAHRLNHALVVRGRQEKEGNYYWLYNISHLGMRTLDTLDEIPDIDDRQETLAFDDREV